VADGRGLPEAWRAIDELRSERREYVRRDVYVAERDADRKAIKRLEDDDTTKTSSNRAWLLNLAGIIVAAIVTGVITVLIARGGH
jgi:hypothetical protein